MGVGRAGGEDGGGRRDVARLSMEIPTRRGNAERGGGHDGVVGEIDEKRKIGERVTLE